MSDNLTEMIVIRTTKEMRQALQALADADGRTLTAMIRRLLAQALKETKGETGK